MKTQLIAMTIWHRFCHIIHQQPAKNYRQTSVSNTLVDHTDVVGAPTKISFST